MSFKIKDLRDAVSVLNYIRNDFSGSTREEQLRCNLRERYAQHIADVQELLNMTPIRFEKDIQNARHAIESALAQILQNETRQVQANAEPAHLRLANTGEIAIWVEEVKDIPEATWNAMKQRRELPRIVVHVDFKNKAVIK